MELDVEIVELYLSKKLKLLVTAVLLVDTCSLQMCIEESSAQKI